MNYYECSNKGINKTVFFYIDNDEYLADDFFIKNKLKIKFKDEMASNKNNYRILFVKVNKKQKDLFIDCMEQLHNKMILKGYRDYDEICDDIMKKFKDKPKRKVK